MGEGVSKVKVDSTQSLSLSIMYLFLYDTAYTVNVDIFTCINFHVFIKMGNFSCIKIRVLSIFDSLGCYKSYFRGVHISRIFKIRELCENMYTAKISTFTVYYIGFTLEK